MTSPIVLASTSATRRYLLTAAGVPVLCDSPGVEEGPIKAAQQLGKATPASTARVLAETKAIAVSPRHKGAMVIGADQLLECRGRWFDKPVDRAAACEQLRFLRGKTHLLHTAVVVVRDGVMLWQHSAEAALTMREFTDHYLEDYLYQAGESVLNSVGAYQLEALGVQLFSRIKGDHFTIMGLPLLPLLGFLRENGALP